MAGIEDPEAAHTLVRGILVAGVPFYDEADATALLRAHDDRAITLRSYSSTISDALARRGKLAAKTVLNRAHGGGAPERVAVTVGIAAVRPRPHLRLLGAARLPDAHGAGGAAP
jgi:hypothetical protein